MKSKSSPPSRRPSRRAARKRAPLHVIVLGVGNIGSHLVPLLARWPEVGSMTLVDDGRYEMKNLTAQDLQPSDIGRPKARVQARRAQRLNPKLKVLAIVGRLEEAPLGLLRGQIILACLDSKESRRSANEIAWRLGIPLLDAGVEASAGLARVSVFRPGPDQPCLECLWDEQDYQQLNTRHPCQVEHPRTPATGAPACLGSLAAALQTIACQNFLSGRLDGAASGKELLMEVGTHKNYVTALRRNPHCRFDHRTWNITPVTADPSQLSLGQALQLRPGNGPARLGFGGKALVDQLACPGCGLTRKVFRLTDRLRPTERACERCHRPLLPTGFHLHTHLAARALNPRDTSRSLASLGFRPGDVFSVSVGGREKHYELRIPGAKP